MARQSTRQPSAKTPKALAPDPRLAHPLAAVDLNLLVVFDVLMRERSVSRAALVLHRTASAVSHALGRLRHRLRDPLLVREGGRMTPTPRAERLWADLQPMLGGLRQVLQSSAPFEPAGSTRRFRIAAFGLSARGFAQFYATVRAQAPQVQLLMLQPDERTLEAVRDGGLDLAVLPRQPLVPEGLQSEVLTEMPWGCVVRQGHPSAPRWSLAEWQRCEHLGTDIGRVVLPLAEHLRQSGLQRRVGLVLPQMQLMGELLESTDMVATISVPLLDDLVRRYRLQQLPVPFKIPPLPIHAYRSSRWGDQPALDWLLPLLRHVMHTQTEPGA